MSILGRAKRKDENSENRTLDVTASMQGSLIFQEPVSLRISGRFQGMLQTQGDLTLGEKADVEADVTGDQIAIAGRLTGKVLARKSLLVMATGSVNGDVTTPILQVEPGGRIEGTVHMASQGFWMTLEEVAGYLEVEARLAQEWAATGKIPATQKSGQWRFEKAKIDEWVATQKNS